MKTKVKDKYLFCWLGMFPGYKTFKALKELTSGDKQYLKEGKAVLFTIKEDEIVPISLNGKRS